MSIQELLDILHKQNELHDQLLELAEQKRVVLIRNEVDQLNSIVNREGKLVRQIGELERERAVILNQYLTKRGFWPDPRITISDLVKLLVKAEEKRALMDAQQALLLTLGKLKEKNKINQQLIEQSLKFIDYSLDLFAGAPDDEAVYTHPGQQSYTNRRPGMFDTRA